MTGITDDNRKDFGLMKQIMGICNSRPDQKIKELKKMLTVLK